MSTKIGILDAEKQNKAYFGIDPEVWKVISNMDPETKSQVLMMDLAKVKLTGGGSPDCSARLIEIPEPEGNEGKYLITDGKFLYWDKIIVSVPIGGIISYSGAFGGEGNRFPCPPNFDGEPDLSWVLCDGQETYGIPVPDLRDRFILGASEKNAQGTSGGTSEVQDAIQVTAAGSCGLTSLSEGQMATHQHGYSRPNTYNGWASGTAIGFWYGYGGTNGSSATVGNNEPHTHTMNLECQVDGSILPPYYVLSYIMRVK